MTTFVLNNVTFKTNDKNYFGKVIDGKTLPITREEYTEAKAQFDAQAPAEPEAPKTPAEPKPAKAVVLTRRGTEYTISEDTRGRITFKQEKTIIAMVQPAKTHFTVYVSKHLLTTPDQVIDALSKFSADAKVNPTFKKKDGRDPFSVKATVTGALRTDVNEMVNLLIKKNNEVVPA
jgi:lipoprotein-anchoring transpeptidase ErfK/SrfK